ncbi:hypothetical protein E4U57_007217 [Claviceps arundinis]|uniref:Uncharacterized protein n=1 Tax=Claviceps arundinis TaxID=1623583 RepID=A0A9P7MUH5_9HYPO|nr:hypothetical protein E4U57_007217 [Claviceps arundinis]KAG5969469.1 hypothetical protein E4U56_008296 [Claviceps arundinis]
MPSYIPASGLGIPTYSDATSLQPNTRFIVSSSGHAAHPNDIRESCHALLEHVTQLGQKAERELQEFEAGIRERELVENRRRAPGWLDSNSRLLEPQRMSEQREPVQGREGQGMVEGRNEAAEYDEGAQLDKAFGGLGIK